MLSLFLLLVVEESMPTADFSMQGSPRGRPRDPGSASARKLQHQEGAYTAERNGLLLSVGAAPQLRLLVEAQRLDLTLN